MNPWNPPRRRTLRPAPPRGGLRPPRHLCTRRPVSSGATGRRDGDPVRRRRAQRRSGHAPRPRSPFPSVSSSSSSFVSCGFPRLFRLLLQSGDRLPDLLLRAAFRQPFDRVQVSENLVQPELAFRHRPSGFRASRLASVRLRPALPGSAPSSGSVRTTGFQPSVFPAYHPVPASCSARLLFVSFMVRISFRFVFSSVRFSFGSARFGLSCARSRLLQFVFPSRLSVPF